MFTPFHVLGVEDALPYGSAVCCGIMSVFNYKSSSNSC
jgi:hypothetical protein